MALRKRRAPLAALGHLQYVNTVPLSEFKLKSDKADAVGAPMECTQSANVSFQSSNRPAASTVPTGADDRHRSLVVLVEVRLPDSCALFA